MRAACSGRTAAARSIISAMHGRVDIQVGTLSKAIGALGGYVAGNANLIDFLYHRARPFLFSTSHPPASSAACIAALDVLIEEPEIIERLWENTRFFKEGLAAARVQHRPEREPDHAGHRRRRRQGDALSDRLFERGVFAQGDRLPDRGARQGARAHDRDGDAHARGSAVRARRVRRGRPGDRPDLKRRWPEHRDRRPSRTALVRRVDARHRARRHRARICSGCSRTTRATPTGSSPAGSTRIGSRAMPLVEARCRCASARSSSPSR